MILLGCTENIQNFKYNSAHFVGMAITKDYKIKLKRKKHIHLQKLHLGHFYTCLALHTTAVHLKAFFNCSKYFN